jgi:hypothetical protein
VRRPHGGWEYEDNAEAEQFAQDHGLGLDEALLGQLLGEVLDVTRRQRPEATLEDKLAAWNYYLRNDGFLEYNAEGE